MSNTNQRGNNYLPQTFVVFVSAFLFLFSIIGFSYAVGLEDGLIAHYSFDNIGNISRLGDDSGNNYNSTLFSSNNMQYVSGVLGDAVQALPNSSLSYYIIPEDVAFDSAGKKNYSFSAWIKPTNQHNALIGTIFSLYDGAEPALIYSSGKVIFLIRNTFELPPYEEAWSATSTYVPPGEWTNIIAGFTNYTGTIEAFMYINGQSVPITNITGYLGFGGGDNNMRFFMSSDGTSTHFNGSIDEVSIWGNELHITDTIARAIYNEGAGLPFSSYSLESPSQIASIANIESDPLETNDHYMSWFFSNYDGVDISWVDPIGGTQLIECSIGDTSCSNYSNSRYNVTVSPYSDNIRVRYKSSTTQVEPITFTYTVFNDLGEAVDTFAYSVGAVSSTDTPQQTASYATPIIIGASSNLTLNHDNFYSGADAYYIQYQEYYSGAWSSQYMLRSNSSAVVTYQTENITLLLENHPTGIRTIVRSNLTGYVLNINITPSNAYGNGDTSKISVIVNPESGTLNGTAPTQIQSPGTITLNA